MVRVPARLTFRRFSREPVYHRYPVVRKRPVLSSSTRCADLPTLRISTLFNLLFRLQAGVSLLRLSFTHTGSNGIFTVSSIGFALRLILRTRLTLIRLTLIRNPWSFGEEVSRLLYRYLYLHLLFQTLQHFSRNIFCAFGMLPYQYLIFHSFGIGLHARLLSTQRHSTSELLRTL